MQNPNDKHAASNTNPKYVVIYTAAGAVRRPNPNYDPKCCPKCGKRHGLFQARCK